MRSLQKDNLHFLRHYVEMVLVMFLGMAVVGLPAAGAMSALGVSSSELRADAPELLLLRMGVVMTVPMLAWMRYRGHDWPASAEMAAAMLIPTFGAMALVSSGVVDDVGALLVGEHVVMLPAMLLAMLLRRDEYSGGTGHASRPGSAARFGRTLAPRLEVEDLR